MMPLPKPIFVQHFCSDAAAVMTREKCIEPLCVFTQLSQPKLPAPTTEALWCGSDRLEPAEVSVLGAAMTALIVGSSFVRKVETSLEISGMLGHRMVKSKWGHLNILWEVKIGPGLASERPSSVRLSTFIIYAVKLAHI